MECVKKSQIQLEIRTNIRTKSTNTNKHILLNSVGLLQICCGLCQILLSASNNTSHTESYQQATTKQLHVFSWGHVYTQYTEQVLET